MGILVLRAPTEGETGGGYITQHRGAHHGGIRHHGARNTVANYDSYGFPRERARATSGGVACLGVAGIAGTADTDIASALVGGVGSAMSGPWDGEPTRIDVNKTFRNQNSSETKLFEANIFLKPQLLLKPTPLVFGSIP